MDFKDKHGSAFCKALDFITRHKNACTDEEWMYVAQEMSTTGAERSQLETALFVEVLYEIERVCEEKSKGIIPQNDYPAIFKRIYLFAMKCDLFAQNQSDKEALESLMYHKFLLQTQSVFESRMTEVVHEQFVCFSIAS